MRQRIRKRLALPSPDENEPREEGWDENFDKRQNEFSQMHSHLLGLRQSSFEKSDELIVTISSAFLGLSVGFVKDIVPLQRSIWMPLLVLSWFCFFVAILTNFVSHFWARNAIEDQIDCARYYYLEGRTKYLDPHINRWTRLTEGCNTVAATLFGWGVLLTLVFVSRNVLREQKYQYDKASEPAKAQSGSTINKPRPQSANTATNSTDAATAAQGAHKLTSKP